MASIVSPTPDPTATSLRVQVVTQTAPPHHGSGASAGAYGQQWIAWWILLALLTGAVTGGAATWLLAGRDRATSFRLAAWVGFFVGIIGAIGHVIFVDLRSDEKFIPIFDETTLLWAAVAVASLLVPFLSEFSFGGASFKLSETQKTAEDVVEKATDLTQNWTKQIAQFLAELESGISSDEFVVVLGEFLQLRAYEAIEWLSADGEKRRLSLWLYDDRSDTLSIYFNNGITDRVTKEARVKNGTGIVGSVYRLQQQWNERDAPSLPVWIPIKADPPRYHGIFLTPVNYADLRLGVLVVDRRKREVFPESAVDVMCALATVFAIAIGNENARQLLPGGGGTSQSSQAENKPNG